MTYVACVPEPTLWTDTPPGNTLGDQLERLVATARCWGCEFRAECARLAAEWHPEGQTMAGVFNPPTDIPAPRSTDTHCTQGHRWDEGNNLRVTDAGKRVCRRCHREAWHRRKAGAA